MQEGYKGRRTFTVTCQHGTTTLDRLIRVRAFLGKHGQCNPAWEPLLQQPSETDDEHYERIQHPFWFPKAGTAFVGFPDTYPAASSKGGSYMMLAVCRASLMLSFAISCQEVLIASCFDILPMHVLK